MPTQLQRLVERMQDVIPCLDGWRFHAKYIANDKWKEGKRCGAANIYDYGDRAANIEVRRNWKTFRRRQMSSLAEWLGHEMVHPMIDDQIDTLPPSKAREKAREILASRVGAIVARAIEIIDELIEEKGND